MPAKLATLHRIARITLSTVTALIISLSANAQKLDLEQLHGLEARSIGPAGMSGRVTAIGALDAAPNVIYAGTASGGLWKSTSGGTRWEPIFDDQPVASIGAISIYQNNPSIIYVGTGEGNPRNSQTNGNGVYKTLDAGRTWSHVGLNETQNIHRIIVHPDNPDVVYVAAQGPAWGETEMRGVFKSVDGGETWDKILYANERTGPGEMVMDPSNPDKLIVAMWEFRRWPWFFKSGGEGSGLHVTHDGGETWKERTEEDGLPKGELGRIGLSISPSDPEVIYALVEAEKNALYRSEDGGFSFRQIADEGIGGRPFYYHEIHVDSRDHNRVYNLHSSLEVSEDGGKTFRGLTGGYNVVHPDHHAWWQSADNPDLIYNGNDGGLYISRDRGESWRFVENLPLAQFYHINVDMAVPYNVMGGLQDNGSWHGPSQVWRAGGIKNHYWKEVAFGDGFDVVPDRSNDRYVYAMSQGGNLYRSDLETGSVKGIKPTHPDTTFLRFNWNAGIAHDPFDDATIYYGSQFLHKSTDRGETWEIISPDLTTNDPEKQKQLDSGGLTYDVTNAENFTTIVSVAPSPVQEGVIWVGTDDGNVQLTLNGGESWSNVVDGIVAVADGVEGAWVTQIRVSTYDAGEAFVVFDDHRRDNWEPYVFHTDDFGATWSRLVEDEDVFGYALAVAQDPVEPNLIFLGTEFGLYVSVDGADTWTKWTNGFPTVSTMDLVIHPREHDLVIGTFGRSAYVLDDIRPLRTMAIEGLGILEQPLAVYPAPDAYIALTGQSSGTRFAAHGEFFGETRPLGALITFSINEEAAKESEDAAPEQDDDPDEMSDQRAALRARLAAMGGGGNRPGTPAREEEEVTIEIIDTEGEVIRTLKRSAKSGVNRTTWGLRRKGVRMPMTEEMRRYMGGDQRGEPAGPNVIPGTYSVRVTYGDHKDSTRVVVHMDPRVEYRAEDIKAREALYDEWAALVTAGGKALERLMEVKSTVEMVNKQLGDRSDETAKELKKMGGALLKRLQAFNERVRGKEVQGIRRDPNTIMMQVFTASSYITGSFDAPGQAEERSMAKAEAATQELIEEVNAFFDGDWATYRSAVEQAELSLFKDYEPIEIGAEISEEGTKEREWTALFDGESFHGWRGFKRDDVPGVWSIDDGALHCAPGDPDRGDLITDRVYDNFILELEWKIGECGNSGIMFDVEEAERWNNTFDTGPEMQVLDNTCHPDAENGPDRWAGANYALQAPSVDNTKPAGEWNSARLVVDGNQVEHWLNGEKVVEYEIDSAVWNAQVAASKFADFPGYATAGEGHIALQDHGDPVWFRNVRIRER